MANPRVTIEYSQANNYDSELTINRQVILDLRSGTKNAQHWGLLIDPDAPILHQD